MYSSQNCTFLEFVFIIKIFPRTSLVFMVSLLLYHNKKFKKAFDKLQIFIVIKIVTKKILSASKSIMKTIKLVLPISYCFLLFASLARFKARKLSPRKVNIRPTNRIIMSCDSYVSFFA